MAAPQPLPLERLYRACNPEQLGFRTTEELAGMDRPPGHVLVK